MNLKHRHDLKFNYRNENYLMYIYIHFSIFEWDYLKIIKIPYGLASTGESKKTKWINEQKAETNK